MKNSIPFYSLVVQIIIFVIFGWTAVSLQYTLVMLGCMIVTAISWGVEEIRGMLQK